MQLRWASLRYYSCNKVAVVKNKHRYCLIKIPIQFPSLASDRCRNQWSRYLGVQALQVGADVLDAGSERVHVQEGGDDPWNRKANSDRVQTQMVDSVSLPLQR